jgi:hypothetical protein
MLVLRHDGWRINVYPIVGGRYIATCWRGVFMFNVEADDREQAITKTRDEITERTKR